MSLLHAVGNGADDKLYVDDVFSTYLYTGNGSTQTINNGIDLAGKGGMVWVKGRSGAWNHLIYDTVRGATARLSSNLTDAQEVTAGFGVTSFSGNGFTGAGANAFNESGKPFSSWTFRKAPKFFDVVTYTGNGVAGRQIPHELGVVPGMIIVKRTDSSGDWLVQARMTSNSSTSLKLNSSGSTSSIWNGETLSLGNHTAFVVSPGGTTDTNINGATYVAYLWAHDPSEDGMIQCGSFTTDGSGNATVELGWEPQYLLVKTAIAGTGEDMNWQVYDSSRGLTTTGQSDSFLYANTSDTESQGSRIGVSAVGFSSTLSNNSTQIYMAIRRPNKVPTSGTEVYNAIARTGTGAYGVQVNSGFASDAVFIKARDLSQPYVAGDRLRGRGTINFSDTTPEKRSELYIAWDTSDGVKVDGFGPVNATFTYINHFFKRAKGFFDIVCYTGTGVARTVNHNLGVVPELIIVKQRDGNTDWNVYHSSVGPNYQLRLNWNIVPDGPSSVYWNNTLPTDSVFTVGTSTNSNRSGNTHVAYLFASLPGISKVGSYTGNGSSQTINCGFTTGARFILIKRTDSTGDWYIWDTVRGIVAANDPHLSLNSTAAEVTTDDSIDPEASGFIVNQNTATNINVLNGTYIFLAIS